MMRFFMKGALLLSLSLTCLADDSGFVEGVERFRTSFGADLQNRHMTFEKDRAPGEVTKPSTIQGSGYLSFSLPWIGLELGYERSTQDLAGTLNGPDTYFGDGYGGVPVDLLVRTRVSGPYANLTGFLPVSEIYRIKLLGFVGMGRLKTEIVSQLPDLDVHNLFSQRRWIPRLGMGVQHIIDKDASFGIRAMMVFEKTSKFKDMQPQDQAGSPLRASLKNSFIPSLGVFYNF